MYESARRVRERIITTEILKLERRLAVARADRERAALPAPATPWRIMRTSSRATGS